jgi:hypothetical protein
MRMAWQVPHGRGIELTLSLDLSRVHICMRQSVMRDLNLVRNSLQSIE